MNYYSPCEVCKKEPATDQHHLFSQSKVNKKLYGKLIHHPSNIIFICRKCHLNSTIPKMTEQQFCDKLGIEVRSKLRS